MSQSILNTAAYQYSLIVIGCLTELIILILFIIELYHILLHKRIIKKQTSSLNISKLMSTYHIFPLFIYSLYLILGATNIITWLKISQQCFITHFIGSVSFILSKGFLYEYFILRLHVMYTKCIDQHIHYKHDII